MAGEVNGLKKTIAAIKDLEAQVGMRTYDLAVKYADLYHESGESWKKAAKIADAHNLSYAHTNNMKRLVLWGELVHAIAQASGGGSTKVDPLFTEHSVRPLLNDWFWSEAGPGGLAELWLSLEVKKPRVFVAACKSEWPKPTAPAPSHNEESVRFQKVLKETSLPVKTVHIDDYFAGFRKSKNLAQDLHDLILAKWKTWDAFLADVAAVAEDEAIEARMLEGERARRAKNRLTGAEQ